MHPCTILNHKRPTILLTECRTRDRLDASKLKQVIRICWSASPKVLIQGKRRLITVLNVHFRQRNNNKFLHSHRLVVDMVKTKFAIQTRRSVFSGVHNFTLYTSKFLSSEWRHTIWKKHSCTKSEKKIIKWDVKIDAFGSKYSDSSHPWQPCASPALYRVAEGQIRLEESNKAGKNM